MNHYPGRLILVVGTSGSGKGALMKRAKQLHPDIVFPVSCTTRVMRPAEHDGETYHFVSEEVFNAHRDKGDFLEWASYGGNLYGTLKSEILTPLEEGKVVLREVDVQGVRAICALVPDVVVIYVDAGPWEVLERRIRGRAPISEEALAARHARYDDERAFMHEATHVVENPDGKFAEADEAFEAIIASYLHRA